LQVWAGAHALGLLSFGGVSLAVRSPVPATAFGVVSLLVLVFKHRGRWTPAGSFGPANAVTALRLSMIGALCVMGLRGVGPGSALLVLLIFALDGLDGWLAKRGGHAAAFGARFDMECDALLVLICTMLLYFNGRLGAFILLPGFLRYLYALAIACLPQSGREIPPSRMGRYVFSVFAGSMIASLWPIEPLYRPLATTASVLIVWSFARAFIWSHRHAARGMSADAETIVEHERDPS
jgi:phosphatidylglycerophosphate synthase